MNDQFDKNLYNLTWKFDNMKNNLLYFNLTFKNVSYISIDSNYEDFLVCEILDRFAFYSSDAKQFAHPGYLRTIKPIRK